MRAFPVSTLLLSVMSVAVVSGCGGGGGGGSSEAAQSVTIPTEAETGLPAPTRVVKLEDHFPFEVIDHLLKSYRGAANANALRTAGRLAPGLVQAGTSPFACAGGGNVTWTNPTPTQFAYSYNACQDGGYAFSGTSSATGSATAWQQTFDSLQAGGTPVTLAGTVNCSVAGGSTRCLTTHGTDWVYGYDARYSDGKANGTHRDFNPMATWNVTFTDFATTSGTAVVAGSNGWALVSHGGTDKDYTVTVRRDDGTGRFFSNVNCPKAPVECPPFAP